MNRAISNLLLTLLACSVCTLMLVQTVHAQQNSPDETSALQQSSGGAAPAKDASASAADDLQKAVENPVASLISVPVQNNSNFSAGPLDRTQNVLNIQPVIP